jgi:hypothetical protein
MQEVLPVERLVRDAKRSETIVRRSQLGIPQGAKRLEERRINKRAMPDSKG